jgi:hypothetical protein
MTKITLIALAIGLLFVGGAQAATIGDLTGLGYTVSVSNPGPNPDGSCPIYFISGHGVQTYASACDPGFQAQVDSLANPATICNADWQANHPDQLQAYDSLGAKGWSVTGSCVNDSYTITNPNDGTTAYTGNGAGLVTFDAQNGAPPAAAPNAPATPTTTTPSNCLPVCPTPTTPAPTTAAPAPAAPATTTTTTVDTTPTSTTVNTTVNVTVNVTPADTTTAASQPAQFGANRLLSSAISNAMKQTVVFTSKTRCLIRVTIVPCWKLWPQIAAARKITLTGRPAFGGVAVTRISVTP